jgi:hypothetical protein
MPFRSELGRIEYWKTYTHGMATRKLIHTPAPAYGPPEQTEPKGSVISLIKENFVSIQSPLSLLDVLTADLHLPVEATNPSINL